MPRTLTFKYKKDIAKNSEILHNCTYSLHMLNGKQQNNDYSTNNKTLIEAIEKAYIVSKYSFEYINFHISSCF